MNKSIYIFLIAFTVVTGKYSGPTNQAGINIIKEFEGFHPNFYNDSAGHHFIGYGHVCRDEASCLTPIFGKYDVPLTPENAEELLKEDLHRKGGSESCVNNAIVYNQLNNNQFSALVSFVQNMGCNYFRSSYLRNKVNRGHIKAAEHEFGRHVYAGGRRQEKLVRRRIAERKLFSIVKPRKQHIRRFKIKNPGEECGDGYEPYRSTVFLNVEFCSIDVFDYVK